MPTDWRSFTYAIGDRSRNLHRFDDLARIFTPPTWRQLCGEAGTALYLLTFAAELPAFFARGAIVLLVQQVLFAILGWSEQSLLAHLIVSASALPTLWSLAGVFGVWGGGWWWRQQSGGRPPSERERRAYEQALCSLENQAGEPLVHPTSWFVLDSKEPDAGVCGSSLCISRALLESDALEAVLAHELGHLRSSDGRITAALNRLVLFSHRVAPVEEGDQEETEVQRPSAGQRVGFTAARFADVVFDVGGEGEALIERFFRFLFFMVRIVFRIARGGIAVRVLDRPWAAYWRGREYAADRYAASLGQGPGLADFLEIYALPSDGPVPFMDFSNKLHPSSELRIDQIDTAMGDFEGGDAAGGDERQDDVLLGAGAVAQGMEPVKRARDVHDGARRRSGAPDGTPAPRLRQVRSAGRAAPARTDSEDGVGL